MTATALLRLPANAPDDLTELIPIGFYGRISLDPDDTQEGVDRQQWEAEHYIDGRGVVILGDPYIDNDLSAWKRNVKRPHFDRLLNDLRKGTIRGVVLYDIDRLTRQPIQLEHLIEIFETHPDYVFYTVHGDLDLSTKQGVFFARLLVNVANDSSRATSERLKDMHKDLARKGVAVGGVRSFGWQASAEALVTLAEALLGDDPNQIYVAKRRVNDEMRRLVHKDEADLIKQASVDLRNGVKRGAIVAQWNAAGVLTATGRPWCSNSITKLMTNPRLAGIRTLKGQIVRNDDGTPVVGKWEPILSVDEFETLNAVLTDPARHGISAGRNKYFGSSVFRCGKCGHSMGARRQTIRKLADGTPRRNYQCGKSSGGCGSVGCSAEPAEAWLEDTILTYLRDVPVPNAAPVKPWPGEDDMRARNTVRSQLMERITAGTISDDFGWREIEKLDADIRRLTTDRTAWLRAHPVQRVESPATVIDQWAHMTVDQRRAVVLEHIRCVVVAPSGRTGRRFDPTRLTVMWRD